MEIIRSNNFPHIYSGLRILELKLQACFMNSAYPQATLRGRRRAMTIQMAQLFPSHTSRNVPVNHSFPLPNLEPDIYYVFWGQESGGNLRGPNVEAGFAPVVCRPPKNQEIEKRRVIRRRRDFAQESPYLLTPRPTTVSTRRKNIFGMRDLGP
jgi:hypothetical protein